MAIIALDIKARQPLAGGQAFGEVGPYLQLDGTAHFAVDPSHPGNRCITDLDLAPRGDDGRVRFSADVRILTPEAPRRGSRRLLFDVVNRGNRLRWRCSTACRVRSHPPRRSTSAMGF
jgi:hypothetical protein